MPLNKDEDVGKKERGETKKKEEGKDVRSELVESNQL
jgi:hypothetical protein